MASSGRFTNSIGSFLHLHLDWEVTSQDIANNRSRVRLTLRLQQNGSGMWFSANKTGSLHGSGFTYTGGFSGTGTRTLHTRNVWVNHNSDGTRSQSFSASFNIAITYSGSYRSSISVSGTANLDRIPRASSIQSFSNFSVRPNQSNSFSLSLSRASSSFTHNITLRVNGENIQSWNGQGLPSSLSLSSSSSNRILNIMRNSTSITAQLRVQTRSGSTNIGSVLTRNATASVHSSVSPEITGVTIRESVSSIADGLGVYVQGRSRLYISLSTSTGYGARDGSFKISVDGQSSTNKSFTTSQIRNSGTLTVSLEYTNTRGQRTTTTRQVTVYSYSPPTISRLTAERVDDQTEEEVENETNRVLVEVQASISPLNNQNDNSFIIRYRPVGQGFWDYTETISDSNYSIDEEIALEDLSADLAYEVQVLAEDFFRSSGFIRPIPPAFTLMNFHESGEAMAFGGVTQRDRGVEFYIPTYFEDDIYFEKYPTTRLAENTDLNNVMDPGMYYESLNSRASDMTNTPVDNAFSLLVERHAGIKQTFTRHHYNNPQTWIRNYYNGDWGEWREIQFR